MRSDVGAGSVFLTLLAVHPHLVVVFVDPNADRASVSTCRRLPMHTIDDLVAALANGARGRGDLVPGPAEPPA
jgi:hypothetical protein